jgi:SAM domain (Sterile alpha motif)
MRTISVPGDGWDKLLCRFSPEARLAAGAAMQEVAGWLHKLGLGQYAQLFAENDISFSVLSDLTDQDLKEIGISLVL